MRRPQELVDRQQFLQPVSALLQGPRIAGKTTGIARRIDHPRHLRAGELGRLRRAPARGGSSSTASRRRGGRLAADCERDRGARPSPAPASGVPPRRRRSPTWRSPARRACRRGQRPRPPTGEQIGGRRASPVHAVTAAHRHSARRSLPGRRRAALGRTSPNTTRGGRRTTMGSAAARSPQLSRARSACSARATSASRRSSESSRRRCGRISRSTPLSVSFTIASAAPPSGSTAARLLRSGSSRAPRPGRATTQMPTSTILGLARSWKPASTRAALPAQHEICATALARRADQRRLEARRGDAALRQRAGDQLALPGGVGVAPPVLQGAATADLEVRARRRFAMARRRQHFDKVGGDPLAPPRSMLAARLGLDPFAWQGKRHEVAPALVLGDAVPAGTDVQDVERDGQSLSCQQLWPGASRRQQANHVPDRRMKDLVALFGRQHAKMVEQRCRRDFGANRRHPSPAPRWPDPAACPETPSLTLLTSTAQQRSVDACAKTPVPAIMKGSAFMAARMRVAASASCSTAERGQPCWPSRAPGF